MDNYTVCYERKEAIAKKIAAIMVIEASMTADIMVCRKNDDTIGEKELMDIQRNLNDAVLESVETLDSFDSLTEAEIDAFEAKVDGEGMSALKAKLSGAVKSLSKEKKKEGNKYTISDKREHDPYFGTDNPLERAKKMSQYDKAKSERMCEFHKNLEEVRKKNSLKDIQNCTKVEKKDSGATKFRNLFAKIGDKVGSADKSPVTENSADAYITNAIKYSHMIEDVCKRYESGIISYESTAELIDSMMHLYKNNTVRIIILTVLSFFLINHCLYRKHLYH